MPPQQPDRLLDLLDELLDFGAHEFIRWAAGPRFTAGTPRCSDPVGAAQPAGGAPRLPIASLAPYNIGRIPRHAMDFARTTILIAALAAGSAVPVMAAAESPRQVLEDFGFLGRWSPRCDQPPSPGNSLRTTSVTPTGAVGFNEQFGKDFKENSYEVLRAERIAGDQVSIRIRLNRETTQDLVMAIHEGRLRTMANRPLDGANAGRTLVKDGRVTASGAPTPWMSRCP
jgi:hypothetical protein